jgi:N-acetylglutamate synthase-like GNAT family acetyltransferase
VCDFVKREYDISDVYPYLTKEELTDIMTIHDGYTVIYTTPEGIAGCGVLMMTTPDIAYITFLCVGKSYRRKKVVINIWEFGLKTALERGVKKWYYVTSRDTSKDQPFLKASFPVDVASRPINHKMCKKYGLAVQTTGKHAVLRKRYSTKCPSDHKAQPIEVPVDSIVTDFTEISSPERKIVFQWKPWKVRNRSRNKDFEMCHLVSVSDTPTKNEFQAFYNYIAKNTELFCVLFHLTGNLHTSTDDSCHLLLQRNIVWYSTGCTPHPTCPKEMIYPIL